LRYITNSYDRDKICQVRFPEINSNIFYANTIGEDAVANGNYKLSTIVVDLNTIFLDNGKRLLESFVEKPISLKKVELTTLSNKKYTYDVGEIQLFKENRIKTDFIRSLNSMASSQNYSISTYRTEVDITINKIESPMLDLIPKVFEIEINGSPYSNYMNPFNFKAEDDIEIMFRFKQPDEIADEYRFADYFFPFILQGVDKDENLCQIYQPIYSQHNTNFSLKDINKLKHESR
jgi:hypothetical protein